MTNGLRILTEEDRKKVYRMAERAKPFSISQNTFVITDDLWAACRWVDSIIGGRGRAVPVSDSKIAYTSPAKFDGTTSYAVIGDRLIADEEGNICQ